MPLTSKLTVVTGFALRLPVSAITVLRLVSQAYTLREASADYSWIAVTPVIYEQIEMHLSIIAATVPCMRLFLKNFNTGYLGTTADQVDPTATMQATKGSQSYALSSVRSRHLDSQTKERGEIEISRVDDEEDALRLRPDAVGTSVSRVGVGRVEGSLGEETGSMESEGSDKIIIRKTVHVDYGRAGR